MWRYRLLRQISKSRLLTRLYYFIVNPAFAREQQAVLAGRVHYQAQGLSVRENRFMLRRNTHRLEKGLLMRPRRPIFAVDYVEETVDTYAFLLTKNAEDQADDTDLKWSHDVLEEYFAVVEQHPQIDRARRQFFSVENGYSGEKRFVPYRRNLDTQPQVTFEALLNLARRRRSVRWYQQRSVPRELIDKAVELASLSPTACNRQPYQFLIFDDPELVNSVAQLPKGTQGFYQNLPVIVALVGELQAYFSERDRHVIYIDAALAAMAFMFALETLGLSSCPINWPDIEDREEEAAKLLGLAVDQRIIMFLAVGYPDPDGLVAYSQKKQLTNLRRYNLP